MSDPREPEEPVVDDERDEELHRLLHGLPEVTPPDGFYDGIIRKGRRRARTVVVVGLVAAGVVGAMVVSQATGVTGEVTPPVSMLADRHDIYGLEDAEERDIGDDVPAPYQAPDELAGMARDATVLHADDIVQVVYVDDGHHVSVFEQAGELEDDAMPSRLTRLHVSGVEAWETEYGAVIVRRSDVVYVLVGDLEPDELAALVAALPDARPLSLTRRIGDAMDDLVETFGFG